jgi:hypothetical protein
MNFTRSRPRAYAVKLALFSITLALFAAGLAGYVFAKTPSSPPIDEQTAAEQTYYKQLTFVANEMHYQLTRWRSTPSGASPAKDKAYVDSLMAPLGEPPEELTVAQAIVDDLYDAYTVAFRSRGAGDASAFQAAMDTAAVHYELFLDNAVLIQNLHQFSGLNVICH